MTATRKSDCVAPVRLLLLRSIAFVRGRPGAPRDDTVYETTFGAKTDDGTL